MKHQMIKDENTQLLLLPCRDALPNAFFYTTFVHAHLFHDQVPLCVIWNGYILHIASDFPKSCDTSRMRYSGTPENQLLGVWNNWSLLQARIRHHSFTSP